MKLKIVVVIAITLTSAAMVELASVASAQQVIKCVGDVRVKRGSYEYRPLGAGERLQPDDLILAASGSIVKVICENGTLWRVPTGKISSLNLGCPERVTMVVMGETRFRPGGSDSRIPYLLYPRMTYLLKDRVTFRWNGVKGVTRYTVRLLGPEGVESQTEVTSTEVVYPDDFPDDAPSLDWRVKYLVTVETDNGFSSLQDSGGVLGFELLDEYVIQKVEEEATKIADFEDRTEEERSLTFAAMYRRENLTAEAIATLEALVKGGSQTAVVYRMLGDLYAEVGLNLLAEARYETALKLFTSTQEQSALTGTRASLAVIKIMLGKEQAAEQLLTQVKAEYQAMGDEQSTTALEQRLTQAATEKEQLETLLNNANISSVTQIITPRN